MNGVHDVGGMQGFGPINRETSTQPFHAPWEGRVCAMMMELRRRGAFNLDEMRRTIESIRPADYLALTYFERWLAALRMLLVEKGLLTPAEVDAAFREFEAGARRLERAKPRGDPAPADAPLAPLLTGPRQGRESPAPRFNPGDRVVARNRHVKEHTRLPRYVRGRPGVVHRVHGVYDLPDAVAHGLGERPEPVYSVCFAARDLWGESAEPNQAVYIDLWESYLSPA